MCVCVVYVCASVLCVRCVCVCMCECVTVYDHSIGSNLLSKDTSTVSCLSQTEADAGSWRYYVGPWFPRVLEVFRRTPIPQGPGGIT